ncbi:site-specific integrase [Serratia sp. BIGb0163]|uniref:site-specific integrase n=1 Tax=Serratia sp. BIGb0163 TaxID=2940613 RepID=UPI00216A7BBB|nr:tyrosine-type recombinase/integrase [Serratia sp. BIGb0163]MCS4268971.1 integrase [Serratia sp. BIGb0163]
MGNSARNQYLYRHESGIWMFQIAVPQHMRHLTNGRRLFRKSTGQRDVQKARTVRDRLVVEWNHVKEKHAVDTETITLNRAINAVQQLGQVSAAASGNQVMLRAVTSEYLAEYKKTRSPSTISKHALAVRLLLEHLTVADTEITGITRTAVTQFIRTLKPKKSAQTIQNYLSGLNSVYEYARRCYDDIPAASPFTGHRLEAKQTVSSYQPFTQVEITTLLAHAEEELHDVIFIGLYSGMRLNEIASLGVDDVSEVDSVKCFRVQVAKTKAGVRLVPIHPALIGIIEKYKQLNAQGQHGQYLLPKANAIKRADAKRGPWFSQQFTRLRNKVLPNATDRQCFHSLRGMFITSLDRHNIDDSRIAALVGHTQRTMAKQVYSQGVELEELSKIIELVNYQGL